ncbi:MAG: hypothetical protein ACI9OJ_003522 [Myxococcota bacterium]|jgi:hypothetical protein
MNDAAQNDAQLNDMILEGKLLEAFDKFYADDVTMTEPSGVRVGKQANREYEEKFLASVQEFHGASLVSSASDNDVSFAEWVFDVTFQDGNRVKMEQTAVRRWSAGKVISERFYYNA